MITHIAAGVGLFMIAVFVIYKMQLIFNEYPP